MSLFRFFRKQRLAARGLSCGKTRLGSDGFNPLTELEEGVLLRGAVILAAATILLFLCITGREPALALREFCCSLLVLAAAVAGPMLRGAAELRKNSRFALFLGLILLQVAIGELLWSQAGAGPLKSAFIPLLVPYALAPLALSILLGPPTGLLACVAGALWWSVLEPQGDSSSLFLPLAGGLSAVLATLRVRRRSRILRAGFYSGLSVWGAAVIAGVVGPVPWDSLKELDLRQIGWESAVVLGTGILTGVLVSGFLPFLEQLFGTTTEISWLEMADLNHPLLRRLSLEAPGTYHHSLALANLAEECAEKVGADPALCRVGAYFHDIGKLVKPEYFTENMAPGANPHDDLTPTMSALVILSHVKEGVDLGLRNKLHRRVIDLIRQHHGTTLVGYFYRRARMQEEDARAGGSLMNVRPGDIPRVSEESYRYPGPKPQTLEAVILGLADAAESASRSLERPTTQRLDDLVHDILRDRIDDGQYDESPVSLCQLQLIADALVSSLGSMHHSRVAYRQRNGETA